MHSEIVGIRISKHFDLYFLHMILTIEMICRELFTTRLFRTVWCTVFSLYMYDETLMFDRINIRMARSQTFLVEGRKGRESLWQWKYNDSVRVD